MRVERALSKEALDVIAAQEVVCHEAFTSRPCDYNRGRADANADTFDILKEIVSRKGRS